MATSACAEENPLYCDLRTPCEDEQRSFCDIDRAYPGTSLENECIARPSANACNRAERCTSPDAPVCSGEDMGICVECTQSLHCDGALACDPRNNRCTPEPIVLCTPGASGDASCASEMPSLPLCEEAGVCVECLTNADCPEGTTCDVAAKSCSEPSSP